MLVCVRWLMFIRVGLLVVVYRYRLVLECLMVNFVFCSVGVSRLCWCW